MSSLGLVELKKDNIVIFVKRVEYQCLSQSCKAGVTILIYFSSLKVSKQSLQVLTHTYYMLVINFQCIMAWEPLTKIK